MTRANSPHRDCRGIRILPGDSVCYGYRDGNTGALRVGTVKGVTNAGVRCSWDDAPTSWGGTRSWRDSLVRQTDQLCVVALPQLQRPARASGCAVCGGTGDLNRNQHERIWDKCDECDGTGEVSG